jgi:nicotinamidase-related amidase
MKTALLVIDSQKIYTHPESDMYCQDAARTVKNINKLIEKFQKAREPIIFIRHVHKADGSDLGRMFDYLGEPVDDFNFKENSEEVEYDETLIRPKGATELVKNRYSAFEGTNLDAVLRRLGMKTVVICGFMTNFCCESTARYAHDKDFFVDFVLDATGTPGTDSLDQKKIRTIVGETMESGFARVMSTNSFLRKS